MNTLPSVIDYRNVLPPVGDQGRQRDTCLAFAITAAHEHGRTEQSTKFEDLSEEVLYWGCKQVDGNYDPGTYFMSAARALQHWGQPPEVLWPYDPLRIDSDASYFPPIAALGSGVCRKAILRPTNINTAAFKLRLASGQVIAVGVLLSRGFFLPVNGFIPMPSGKDIINEGYAILLVGYNDTQGSGDGYFIARNSWGPDWGEAGYGYLTFDYVKYLGREAWLADLPTSVSASC